MKKLFIYIVTDGSSRLLAGSTAVEWLRKGAGDIPYRVIEDLSQAILPTGCDFVAVLHPTTPLVTAKILLDLSREMERRDVGGLEIGAGMLVKRELFERGVIPKRRITASYAEETTSTEAYFRAEKALYRRIAEDLIRKGAIIPDPDAVRVDARSVVEEGAIIEPYVKIEGSRVARGARIGSFSEMTNAEIGAGAEIRRSVVQDSQVGENATIGPFAYIRMGAEIGAGCRVGDFVEIKKSRLGARTKAAHLAYIGDAEVGAGTNVGCGTVFANYDGKVKRRVKVGDRVFIGANSNLVAPVTVGDDVYIAAATTVTRDVPQGSFVIGRTKAENREKRGGNGFPV